MAGRPTVDEVSAPYANFMLTPAPAGPDICSVCRTFNHTLPSLAADLEQAAGRDCTVDVIFETQDDSASIYKSHEAQPFHHVAGIRRWRWPAEQRPAGGAVLHAKALVVDGRRALVGSANLTQRALTANLEVGLLVRDPAVAGAIEAHVHELMANGVLTRS